MEEDGSSVVRVLPITHTPPCNPDDAIEIPRPVKQRLQLNDERSWIVLNESNRLFGWVRTCGPSTATVALTACPPALFAAIKRRFVMLARSRAHVSVPRTE